MADGSQVISILAAAMEGDIYVLQLQTEARGTHWVCFTEGAAREITEVLRRYLARQSLEGPLTLTVSKTESAARADGRKAIVFEATLHFALPPQWVGELYSPRQTQPLILGYPTSTMG